MTGAEKNRYVLAAIEKRLAEGDGFYGRIVLHCKDGRIVVHEIQQTYRTEDVVDRAAGALD